MKEQNRTKLLQVMSKHRIGCKQAGRLMHRTASSVYAYRCGERALSDKLLSNLIKKVEGHTGR